MLTNISALKFLEDSDFCKYIPLLLPPDFAKFEDAVEKIMDILHPFLPISLQLPLKKSVIDITLRRNLANDFSIGKYNPLISIS